MTFNYSPIRANKRILRLTRTILWNCSIDIVMKDPRQCIMIFYEKIMNNADDRE